MNIESIIGKYSKLGGVKAIGIGGSRAARSSDPTSDYDIYLFTEKEPAVEQRLEIVRAVSSKYEVGSDYFGPGDEYFVDELNVEFDVMFFDASWFEGIVRSVWLDGRASNGYTTAFLYTLSNLDIKYDPQGWLKGLKDVINTPYPEKLRQNIIRRNMMLMKDKPFSSYIEQIKKAVERNDLNSLNHRSAAFFESYFDALFAANRLLHPGEKRLIAFALANCRALPQDFEKDIASALMCRDDAIVPLLSEMVEKLRTCIRTQDSSRFPC